MLHTELPSQHGDSPAELRSAQLLRLAALLGILTALGGLVTLIGWFANVPRFIDWFGVGITMKANTALSTVVAGTGVILLTMGPRFSLALRMLGGSIALLGALTLFEHASDWDLGIDTLLVEEAPGAKATAAPGRMGPPASAAFCLIGAALMLPTLRGRTRGVAAGCAVAVMAISLLSITGYLYGAELMYSAPRLTGIAVQSALMLFAVGLGLLVCFPDQAPLRLMLERGTASMLARRLVPIVILLPLGLGWLRVTGQSFGLYDGAFGSAMRTVVEIALLAGLLWWAIAKVRSYEMVVAAGEQKVIETLESITDGFVAFDADWRFVYINDEAAKLLQRSPEELLGKSVWELFPERIGSGGHAALLRAAATRTSVEYQDFVPRFQQWFHAKAYPTTDGGIAVYFKDITSQKLVEIELQAKEQRLQHVTDHAAVMVAQCSRDLRYTFVNKTYADYVGLTIDQIVNQPIDSILGGPAVEAIRPYIDRVLGGESLEYEIEVPYASIGPRWMRVGYVPDYDDEGKVSGWIAAITDVTQRKLAEQALRKADARKDEFLATLAHELRNPLAPVMNSLALLSLIESENEIVAKAVETMDRQMKHMVRLIDDLLDLSRISRGKIELKTARLELGAILHQAIEMIRPVAEESGQRISLELPPEAIHLQGDPARLAQSFGNLLNNACRYNHRGGSIDVQVERQGSDAVVFVRDSGIGIPPEKLEEIFDIFTQVDRSLERTAGGLGIGLHLVRQLIQMHGGTVVATSAGPDQGSEFTVRLPIALEAPLAVAATDAPPHSNAQPLRILVVDDNLDSAHSLAMLLRLSGHSTQTVHDGEAAVTAASTFDPEVILLDIGLPKLNGYDACRAIRNQPRGREIFIVALTGWGQEEDRRKSREAGFDAHLIKPVDLTELARLLGDRQPALS